MELINAIEWKEQYLNIVNLEDVIGNMGRSFLIYLT